MGNQEKVNAKVTITFNLKMEEGNVESGTQTEKITNDCDLIVAKMFKNDYIQELEQKGTLKGFKPHVSVRIGGTGDVEMTFDEVLKQSGYDPTDMTDYPYFNDIDDNFPVLDGYKRVSKHTVEMTSILHRLYSWLWVIGRMESLAEPENYNQKQKSEYTHARKRVKKVLDQIDSTFDFDEETGSCIDRICTDI